MNDTLTQPDLTGKVVYLAGKITGDLVFKTKFMKWTFRLFSLGARKVLNPAMLPDGWEYDEYMEHCLIMVRRCDIVAALPDWEDSKGARSEVAYAVALGKPIKKLLLYQHDPKPPADE